MKRITLFIFSLVLIIIGCIYYHFIYVNHDAKTADPLLVVVIMVKDEEAVIVETLDPFVQGGIDAFLVFDTGSTDKTIERITGYFKDKKITRFAIEQEPFIDFATSRNRGLELAEKHFPHAGFFIMPDAEWYIHGADALCAFCKQMLPFEEYGLYAMETFFKENCNHYDVPRLFRAKSHIRFKGVVHEIPAYSGIIIKIPAQIWIEHRSSEYGDEKTIKRVHRDIKLLSAELEKNPEDTRTLFYLAQSYTVLGDYHTAIKYLKQRVQYGGFEEEYFVALLRMGQMYEQLFFRGEASWHDAEDAFLRAARSHPSRLEPLIHLANHYMHYHNPQLAYEYALKACNTAYPHEDGLFINKELYDFDRWNILARVAANLNKWDEAETAAYVALKTHSDIPELRAILAHNKA